MSKRRSMYAGPLRKFGIEWLEEPLYGYDFEGLAELRRSTTLNIAAGALKAARYLAGRDAPGLYGMRDLTNSLLEAQS